MPSVSAQLTRAAMGDSSHWAIIGSPAEFQLAKAKAARLKKPATVLGLAVPEEVAAIRKARPAFGKHVFELHEFLSFVTRLEPQKCCSGAQPNNG